MTKKIQLKLEQEIDFILYGIVTPFKDFELAFHLNKALSFSFLKHKKDIWYIDSIFNKEIHHTVFQHTNEDGSWNIIQNKGKLKKEEKENQTKNILASETENSIIKCLLEDYKQIDFFLQTPNTTTKLSQSKMCVLINKIPNITVLKLQTENIKEIESLFFE